jgi:hypothetical protein
MKQQLDNIKKTRNYLLEQIKDLTLEQLNKVPAGFNNNIVWNLGHLVAAQQGLCYFRAGVQPIVEAQIFDNYKPGTKPERFISESEVLAIKELMSSTLERFETDYENNLFSGYNTFTTRYGVELSSIDEALDFVLFHEGLHSGYIMALKRVVNK